MNGLPIASSKRRRVRCSRPPLELAVATSAADLRSCQRLRYTVFAGELGAEVEGADEGLDRDRFDAVASHLMVRDPASGRAVATTRFLPPAATAQPGGSYAELEFDLTQIRAQGLRLIEVGRTCIDPAYRSGPALALLWAGLARALRDTGADGLSGCVSLPMGGDGRYPYEVFAQLCGGDRMAPEHLRVHPRVPVPWPGGMPATEVILPALLRAYLRLGAVVCGAPSWDVAFNVADLYILLDREQVVWRYTRRFLRRVNA